MTVSGAAHIINYVMINWLIINLLIIKRLTIDRLMLGKEEASGLFFVMDRQEMERLTSMKFQWTEQARKRSVERRVKKTGVYSSQHRLLMHLNWMELDCEPACSQVELAKKLEISPAAVAVSIKKLEKGGYIHRESSEADSRALQVTVTPKGKMVVAQSISIFQKMDRDIFEGFSDEELMQMSDFLERMYRNLEEKKKTEGI